MLLNIIKSRENHRKRVFSHPDGLANKTLFYDLFFIKLFRAVRLNFII